MGPGSCFPSCFLRGAAALSLALAACGDSTPPLQTCPTSAQSVTFAASGSCGPGGDVVISTNPGYCNIKVSGVDGGGGVGIPISGYFTGSAGSTNYQLAGGNWSLHSGSSDPTANPSSVTCDATAAGTGVIELDCAINDCIPTDEYGFSCQQSTCVMHLTKQ